MLKYKYPTINWHIPGEVDLVVQGLWFSKQVTTEAVLQVDLEIVKACDGLLAMGYEESSGVCRELNQAIDFNIPRKACLKFELPKSSNIAKLVKEAKKHYEKRQP